MAMIKSMRSSVNSMAIKVLMVLLVISFVLFFGYNNVMSCRPSSIAFVEGHAIQEREFMTQLRMQIEQYRQIFGKDLDDKLFAIVQKSVLDRMIQQYLIEHQAGELGVSVGLPAVRQFVLTNFGDSKNGKFDPKLYKRIVTNRLRTTPADFEQMVRRDLTVQRFQNLLRDATKVSKAEIEQRYRSENRQINLGFVTINPELIRLDQKSSEKELQEYYAANRADYLAPARRKLELLAFDGIGQLSQQERETARREYFAQSMSGEGYGEQRLRASHILVKSKKEADKLRSQLLKGADFATLARQHNTDGSSQRGGDLGYFGRKDMVAPFAKVAFQLKPDQLSQPVNTEFGYHLIKVVDSIPAGEISEQRLARELDLKFERSIAGNQELRQTIQGRLENIVKPLKDSASPGSTLNLKEVAQQYKAHFSETPFLAQKDSIADNPDSAAILREAFAIQPLALSGLIQGWNSGNFYVARVIEEEAPKQKAFAEVRAEVERAFQEQLRADKSVELANRVLDAAREGRPLASVADAMALTYEKSGLFSQKAGKTVPGLGMVQSGIEDLFGLQPNASDPKGALLRRPLQVGSNYYVVHMIEERLPEKEAFELALEGETKRIREEKQRQVVESWMQSIRKAAEDAGQVQIFQKFAVTG